MYIISYGLEWLVIFFLWWRNIYYIKNNRKPLRKFSRTGVPPRHKRILHPQIMRTYQITASEPFYLRLTRSWALLGISLWSSIEHIQFKLHSEKFSMMTINANTDLKCRKLNTLCIHIIRTLLLKSTYRNGIWIFLIQKMGGTDQN